MAPVLRADARRNQHRILAAARSAIEESAAGFAVEDVDRRAGDDLPAVRRAQGPRPGRLGRAHRTPETAPRISDAGFMGGARANFDTEGAEHLRMLLPAFSAERMRLLDEKIIDLTGQLGDDMTIAAGDAVILVTAAGNRDERAFADPDAFDAGHPPGPPVVSRPRTTVSS